VPALTVHGLVSRLSPPLKITILLVVVGGPRGSDIIITCAARRLDGVRSASAYVTVMRERRPSVGMQAAPAGIERRLVLPPDLFHFMQTDQLGFRSGTGSLALNGAVTGRLATNTWARIYTSLFTIMVDKKTDTNIRERETKRNNLTKLSYYTDKQYICRLLLQHVRL